MAGYDIGIFGVFLIGSIFYILWIVLFLKRRRKLDYMSFQEASANQSNIVQLINGMQDIKLNNCEKQKRWEWESIQARLFKVSIKSLTLEQSQEVGGTFIDQTKNIIILFLAASAVIKGDMTLGMMMAMQYIIRRISIGRTQFCRPLYRMYFCYKYGHCLALINTLYYICPYNLNRPSWDKQHYQ